MGHLLTTEKLLVRWVDEILGDVKKNAHAGRKSFETLFSSTERLTKEVQYIRVYITKLVRWTQSSIKVVNFFGPIDSGVDLG